VNWWNIKIVLKGASIVTWDSISLSCSPWASTRTAISRKIWCNSSRFFSISFTVSCRSWISRMVSRIWPRPCSWIATWRKFSLSPVSMIFSMVSSSGFSPVIVKYLQLQQMQKSTPQLFTIKLKNQEILHTHDLKFENQETGLGWSSLKSTDWGHVHASLQYSKPSCCHTCVQLCLCTRPSPSAWDFGIHPWGPSTSSSAYWWWPFVCDQLECQPQSQGSFGL